MSDTGTRNYNFPTVPKIINVDTQQSGSTWDGGDAGWWFDCFTDIGASPLSNDEMTRAIMEGVANGIQWRVPHIVRDALRDEHYPLLLGRKLGIEDPRVFYSGSGSEAVEVAMKLMRRATGRRYIVSVAGDFHGRGYGALALSYPTPDYHHAGFGDPLPDILLYDPDTPPDIPEFRSTSKRGGYTTVDWEEIAGIILSPVNGNNTLRMWDSWVWDLVENIQDAGGLLAFDEVQTGFGRGGGIISITQSGEWRPPATPDIYIFGKAAGAGWPMSLTVSRAWLVDGVMTQGSHFNTMAGSPMGCWLSMRLIEALGDGLLGRMLANARRFEEEIPNMVRVGYMMGIRVPDPKGFCEVALRHNVLMMTARDGEPVRFAPPFALRDADVDLLIGRVRAALDEHGVAS